MSRDASALSTANLTGKVTLAGSAKQRTRQKIGACSLLRATLLLVRRSFPAAELPSTR